MQDIILTPIYKNTIYQYHKCSNCCGKSYFEEYVGTPFYFKEKIKYCPHCGGKVIRYANPQFEELPNWDWLQEYREVIDKAYRFLTYKIHCELNEEQRKNLREKAEFGKKYFGVDRYYPQANGNICEMINSISLNHLHYTTKEKLMKEFKK